MNDITLKDIPPELAARIEAEARRAGTSVDATVIRLLQRALFPLDGERKRDLSSFAGSWSKEEADAFDAFLADHRRIDPEDWR